LLLEIKNLCVYYKSNYGKFEVINNMNFPMERGEIVSIVGESASGKSTLGEVLSTIIPDDATVTGSAKIDGKGLVNISENDKFKVRGTDVFMIFQNPLNSLNPVKTIGYQLMETLQLKYHKENKNVKIGEIRNKVIDVLKKLRMPDPEAIMKRYPHQVSGGQVQRIVIAMALLLKPKLLVADEPTTALDVTVQAQVVKLLKELNKEMGMSIIFITHDISLAYVLSDKMLVMYSGRIMEIGNSDDIAKNPMHPYTKGLINSLPEKSKYDGKLESIPGSPPSYTDLPAGCKFNPRCPFAMEKCRQYEPEYINLGNNRYIRCWLYE